MSSLGGGNSTAGSGSPIEGSAQRSPLFLNSADNSSPWSPEAAGGAFAAALDRKAVGLFRAALQARGDNRKRVQAEAVTWDRRRHRVEGCGLVKSITYQCANGHRWDRRPMGCGLRLCPYCARRTRARMQERCHRPPYESHSGSAKRSHLQFGEAEPGQFGEAEPPWFGQAEPAEFGRTGSLIWTG